MNDDDLRITSNEGQELGAQQPQIPLACLCMNSENLRAQISPNTKIFAEPHSPRNLSYELLNSNSKMTIFSLIIDSVSLSVGCDSTKVLTSRPWR